MYMPILIFNLFLWSQVFLPHVSNVCLSPPPSLSSGLTLQVLAHCPAPFLKPCPYVSLTGVPPPPPFSCYLVNPLIPSTAPPLPHTRSRFNPWSPGGAAHVWVVIWRSSPSDFPYKQPQIVMSSVVPVESWRSTFPSNTSSSQGCSHCTFSCITQLKWVLVLLV